MKFKYKAYDRKGKLVKGIVDAENRKQAVSDLKVGSLKVIKIDIVKDSPFKKIFSMIASTGNTVKEKFMGEKLSQKRLESFKEELEYMGHDEIDYKNAISGIELKKFDARKFKKQFELTDIQVEKIMSGRLNKLENVKQQDFSEKSKLSKISLFNRVSTSDLITFTEQLAIMISTDIELIVALETIQKDMNNKKFKRVIDEIIYDLTKGKSLSNALEAHGKIFNGLYIAMVQVGESTGSELHKSLDDLVNFLKMTLKIKREFTQAAIYPAFVVGALVGLVLFVNYFVIPKFRTLFTDNDFEMPWLTTVVFAFSENFVIIIIGTIILTVLLGILIFNVKAFRDLLLRVWDKLTLKVPVLKGAFISMYMYQMTLTLSITLKNGISITDSLNLLSNIIKNKYINKDISEIYYNLEKGKDISEAFGDKETVESIVKMAVTSGEKSGKLNETLDRVSTYYEKELDAKLSTLLQMMVPVSIIVIGVIVGPFLIGLYMPIMSLTEQIGNVR